MHSEVYKSLLFRSLIMSILGLPRIYRRFAFLGLSISPWAHTLADMQDISSLRSSGPSSPQLS